jgi:hypothetical protein
MYLNEYFNESVDPLGEDPISVGIGIASLGVAVFQTGLPFFVNGAFSSQSATVSFVHERTPPTQTFTNCRQKFSLKAHHPRLGFGDQTFVFELQFDYNGNDIRNARVGALVNESSTMVASSFSANFEGREHSVRADPVAEVVFLITGQWDPVGLGYVSYQGKLYVKADGTARLTDVTSERGWVRIGSLPRSCIRRVPVAAPRTVVFPLPYVVFFSPPGSDRIREGDERKLSNWILGLSSDIRNSIQRGQSPIKVDGYSSTTAGLGFNRDLSRRRAARVATLLRDLLGPGARIEQRAMGEVTARTADRTENERERRVEITIQYTKVIGGTE